MPYVQVRVAGELSREQKQQIVAQFTKTLEDVAGKPPSATYIVIEEVSRDNWAKSGKLLTDS
ncbi:MAG: 4-oxalocrotonate tautomerase [Leptospiraceae bacterium]|nr:4-oxalocrotonate tautomerase [Leptospiraceae bacterium]